MTAIIIYYFYNQTYMKFVFRESLTDNCRRKEPQFWQSPQSSFGFPTLNEEILVLPCELTCPSGNKQLP